MSRSGRSAVFAIARLVVLVGAGAAVALWWRAQRADDYRVDRVLRLEPERPGRLGAAVPLTLDAVERRAWGVGVDEVLHFRATIPGEAAALRLDAVAVRGRPELVVAVVDAQRRHREVARLPVGEETFARHRVALGVEPGASVVIEVTVKDGQGRPGLGRVYLADVVLESTGRGVDETRIPLRLDGVVADLLTHAALATERAPRTALSDRYGLPGPAVTRLQPGLPLRLETPSVPDGARLLVTWHASGFPGADARLLLLVDGEPAGRLPLDVVTDPATPAEASVEIGLAGRAPGPLRLEFRLDASAEAFVGLRDVLLLAEQEVARRPFDPERSRNCLLVVVDSLRADRVGAPASTRGHTPVLDELARGGVRYENAYANAAWTRPSLATLLTGTWPLTHGMGREGVVLSPRLLTLAEIASWGGRTTACFSNSEALAATPSLQRGFQTRVVEGVRAPQLAERFADWLADARQFEWFAMLHLSDANYPYAPLTADRRRVAQDPDPDLVARLRGLDSRPGVAESLALEANAYDAELVAVDRALGMALDALDRAGLLASTTIVVTADHGEAFLEHGLRLHGHTLHDEIVRVPLVVAGAGVAYAPRVETTPIDLADAAPVVLRMALLAPSDRMQGELPPPWGPSPTNAIHHALVRPFEGITAQDAESSRREAWLRIVDHVTGTEMLFARDHDPRALTNLLDDEQNTRARGQADALRTAFESWAAASLSAAPAQAIRLELEPP